MSLWTSIAAIFSPAPAVSTAPALPVSTVYAPALVSTSAPSALTGAQVISAISAITPALAAISAAMATPQFRGVVVVAEDIEQILADLDVPGAAVAEQVTEVAVSVAPVVLADAQVALPFLAPLISDWLTAFTPGPSPYFPDAPKSFGGH